MYEDKNFIRILAACETMGNATNLCSDKTGTLTENRMTVVEAWMANKKYNEVEFDNCNADPIVKEIIAENCCLNRTAYLIYVDATGRPLARPNVIGNKTEGALIVMAKQWVSLPCYAADDKNNNNNDAECVCGLMMIHYT